jgi:hypothetical protein
MSREGGSLTYSVDRQVRAERACGSIEQQTRTIGVLRLDQQLIGGAKDVGVLGFGRGEVRAALRRPSRIGRASSHPETTRR